MTAEVTENLSAVDHRTLVVVFEGRVVGAIQWGEEDDPGYRPATIDEGRTAPGATAC